VMDEARNSSPGDGRVDATVRQRRKKLRTEAELTPDEKARLDAARQQTMPFRSHYDCVRDYLRFCEILVELGVKPAGYTPSVHLVQRETGIPCWRTVQR